MSDPIAEYIRANTDRYPPEAIRASLVGAGHDPAQVDIRWEAIHRQRSASSLISWAMAFFWVGFVFVAGGLVFWMWFVNALGTAPGQEGAGIAVPDPLEAVLIVGAYALLGYGVLKLTRWAAWQRRLGAFRSFVAHVGVILVLAAVALGSCVIGVGLTGN